MAARLRRTFLAGLAAFAAVLALADSPPNIVVLLADDQGWGDLGADGHPTIRTPHLDGLARDGASFDRFYVCAVCSPTRAEFLTGRYHLRGGVTGVSRGLERLAPGERTIADLFRHAGYATACFGKWHNGTQAPYHPNNRGFDEFYGFTSGHWGSYFDPMLDHNGAIVTGHGYLADDLADHAIDFMRAQARQGRPFLAYVAFNIPHSPMQVPDKFWEAWNDRDFPHPRFAAEREDRTHTRAALAMVENLDANAGRILAALDELHLAENTIVVYFSDNGPNGHRWNGGLKGVKGSTDEGGLRSPGFFRWSGHIPAGRRLAAPAAAIDLLPTLVGLAGIEAGTHAPWDGADLSSALLDRAAMPANRLLFSEWSGAVSVRGDRYMLDAAGNLFDLRNDPGQEKPLGAAEAAERDRLRAAVRDWRAEMGAAPAPDPAFVVGYPGSPLTQLPARDAESHGGIKRSNRFPNCSYFRNWTSTDDYLSWMVDVPVAGRFAAEVYYACPAADLGSTLELRVGAHAVSARVDQAWDPPEQGPEHDRIPRQESAVKDFRPMSLGIIELPAGRGELRLGATAIPGRQALEFRLLTLRRLD